MRDAIIILTCLASAAGLLCGVKLVAARRWMTAWIPLLSLFAAMAVWAALPSRYFPGGLVAAPTAAAIALSLYVLWKVDPRAGRNGETSPLPARQRQASKAGRRRR